MSVLQRILDTISAATTKMAAGTEDAQAQRSLERLATFAAAPLPVVTVTIAASADPAESSSFTLPGKMGWARIGNVAGSGRVVSIEYSHDGGTTWEFTGVSATANTSGDAAYLDADALVPLIGLCGRENIFRLSMSAVDTAELQVKFFPIS